jgi:hypothetical protein
LAAIKRLVFNQFSSKEGCACKCPKLGKGISPILHGGGRSGNARHSRRIVKRCLNRVNRRSLDRATVGIWQRPFEVQHRADAKFFLTLSGCSDTSMNGVWIGAKPGVAVRAGYFRACFWTGCGAWTGFDVGGSRGYPFTIARTTITCRFFIPVSVFSFI